MTLVVNALLENGLFVPYHQAERGQGNGLVGTLSVDAAGTGDASGGTFSLNIQMSRQEFGFTPVFVPTAIYCQDDLATLEVVRLAYLSQGNRRLQSDLVEVVTPVAQSGFNFGQKLEVSVPIEGRDRTDRTVFVGVWFTNTLNEVYHVHMFGPVYDLEILARSGYVDPLMAGLR